MDVGGKAFRQTTWAWFKVVIELERKIQKAEESQNTTLNDLVLYTTELLPVTCTLYSKVSMNKTEHF